MKGSTVCASHGGKAPHVKAAAEQRIAEERARAKISVILGETLDRTETVDPLTELLRVLWVTSVAEAWLRGEIESPLMAVHLNLGENVTVTKQEEHPLWKMWGAERDRLAKYAKLALDAGVTERQVRILEQQAMMIAELLRRIFDDPRLGLSEKQREVVTVVAGEAMRRLDAA